LELGIVELADNFLFISKNCTLRLNWFFSFLDLVMGTGSSNRVSRFRMTAQDIINECGGNSLLKPLNILVTGATSGIGVETARVLACAGANVYAMGRDEAKLQDVVRNINNELEQQQQRTGGSVQGVICDLNSLASVKRFAQQFLQDNKPLNVLILNAGISNYKFAQTIDGLEQVMGVNHIGHAYLTQLLMPKLIANAPSRIVVVSSSFHAGPPLNYQALDHMSSTINNAKKDWGMMSSYQQSKLANVLFARALASRYKDKQVTAYSLHPGVINTNLASDIPFSRFFKMFLPYKKKSVEQGTATTVYCALNPGLEHESGQYFDDSTLTDLAGKWPDDDVNTLWKWTEKIIRERTANL
jgi:NAD(P)-dependent dehydrogenase (short-subunit alcohol dehydrogenase family)